MFRGSATATIDDKGRIKIPTLFRRPLEDRFGPELFVTSVMGRSVFIYPLQAWEEIEQRLARLPSTDRVAQRFLERVNYFGQQVRMDAQGRVLVPQLLREAADMQGEVIVGGRINHLEVEGHQLVRARLFEEESFTEQDFAHLTEKGI